MRAFLSARQSLLMPALGLMLSLGACSLLLVFLGESPSLLWEAIRTTLFTGFGLGYTLYYATPLIFTGLSVALCFHCGLFNIGAEGQLYIGSLALVIVSRLFPQAPAWVAIPTAILGALAAGGVWGLIPGALKAFRGSHEVIVTILLNFLATSLCDYLILYRVNNPETQNPETLPIPSHYTLPLLSDLKLSLFATTPANFSLILGILVAFLLHAFLFKSVWGFELRSVGLNSTASKFAAISVKKNLLLAFFMSGALAGLVGMNEVMGAQHKVIQGFSPGYGFTGIAVALLARNHPLGILLSAFLFGALHNSARELEFLSERVSKELSFILQAVLIAFVSGHYLIGKLWKRRRA